MDGKKLSERLRFDMKFLLWRAEVYALPADEVERRYQELRSEYLGLSGEQRDRIHQELCDWHLILSALNAAQLSA